KMVSVLLFEDLLIVPLLALVAFLAPAGAEPRDSGSVLANIGVAAAAVAALVAAGLWLLNPLFRILAQSKAREMMTAAALLVVLGSALLMEMSHLSMAMGAFLAGVLLSESSFRHQLEADIEPFRGLLLGLFFLAVGMALRLDVVLASWPLILGGVAALMLAKALCIYVVARLMKSDHDEAIDRAILMAQGGEFAFVLYQAANSQGVIDNQVNANMTAVIVLSMVLTPLVVMAYKRFGHKSKVSPGSIDGVEAPSGQHGNVLLVGFGRVGQIASQGPLARGAQLTVIDVDTEVISVAGRYLNFKVYYGDGSRPEVMHAAGAHHADVVLVCIDDKHATTRIVENARDTCPQAKLVVRAYDRQHALELTKLGADTVIRETFEAAMAMGEAAVRAMGAEPVEAEEISAEVRSRDSARQVLELAGDRFAGRALLLGNIDRIEPPPEDSAPRN
ncbi:MAG: cation:proton antiporter, partial [Pseudomonadota bacterium]|nr:cation:proton antiporter [Pseudomonadota bacterium]